jgi:hypothetical protein
MVGEYTGVDVTDQGIFMRKNISVSEFKKKTVSGVDWICSRSVTSCTRQSTEEEKGQPDVKHERQNFVFAFLIIPALEH